MSDAPKRRGPPLPEVVDATGDGGEPTRAPDVVMLQGPTEDGRGMRALRARPGELALAELRPLEEGKPLGDVEVVRLRRRPGSPILWDVDVAYDGRRRARGAAGGDGRARHAGPPRVNSRRYRDNWERVFGRRRRKGDGAPN